MEELRRKLSVTLADLAPALVLSSPLSRALETCKAAGFGDAVQVNEKLLEWDYGDYEGLTTPEIRAERPGWDLFRDGCPGGEDLAQVAARTGDLVERLRDDPSLAGQAVLLFAHGHVLRVLAAVWARLGAESARALPLATDALGVLGWEHESPVLERWNL